MKKIQIAKIVEEIVKTKLKDAEKGHNWYHIDRVRNMALKIAEIEGGDKEIIELSALLHDISDAKFNGGNYSEGARQASVILNSVGCESEKIEHIVGIIDNISFKGGLKESKISTIEFEVVRDADRLDAIGAIGIARAFNYGGFKNREIYNPEITPVTYSSAEEYHNSDAPTITHFYEKLLLLKDLMSTQTAKKIAEQRHEFMQKYLNQFFEEWKSAK